MQLALTVNKKCTETLPYYSDLSQFTSHKVQEGSEYLNQLYLASANQVNKVTETSKQVKNDLTWMLSHVTDDLIELIEAKLSIDNK